MKPDEDPHRARRKFHAMVGDIAKQVPFCGRKWKPESWKRLLIQLYVNVERGEAEANGWPDPFPGPSMVMIGVDGESLVTLGEQTRHFTKQQMSDLIESTMAFGSEQGVVWSEKTKKLGEEE